MAKENIVNSSLRFNLENEQHLRVYWYLCKLDGEVLWLIEGWNE